MQIEVLSDVAKDKAKQLTAAYIGVEQQILELDFLMDITNSVVGAQIKAA